MSTFKASRGGELPADGRLLGVGHGGRRIYQLVKDALAALAAVDGQPLHGRSPMPPHCWPYKAHLSVGPDSELIDQVTATPANTPDRDAAETLLAGHAGAHDKPEVVGDSAYGDAATRASLEETGFTVTAKCPPARYAAGRYSNLTQASRTVSRLWP